MNHILECDLLIENRDIIKKVYPMNSVLITACDAMVFALSGKRVDADALESCKKLLKKEAGLLSPFNNSSAACRLMLFGNPESTLALALEVYSMLKREFFGPQYLPLAALTIVQLAERHRYAELVKRTRRLYDLMKKEHPLLTSSEDAALCALLSLSEKSDEALISDMEACYALLKPQFFSANSVQSLSHVLSVCDGSAKEKVARTSELFAKLKAAGRKYGTSYELPTLGLIAMASSDLDATVREILELDDRLASTRGFGAFGTGKNPRLMYAGMIAVSGKVDNTAAQTAMTGATLALVIAQQAAMLASISAANAAAAASASH